MLSLSEVIETRRIKPDGSGWTVAAGITDVNSDVVDMAGFEGIRFILALGALVSGAVTSVKIQQGTDLTVTDAADLEGSSVAIADTDDNKIVVTQVYRPRERFVRMAIDRGTANATIDGLVVELFGTRVKPVATHATVVGNEKHVSPAEGSA